MSLRSDQKRTLRRKAFSWLMVLCMVFSTGAFTVQTASAAASNEPAHEKSLIVNDDGTYTLALSVTGDSEKQIQKVNVIVIVDRSGSMGEDAGTGEETYTPVNYDGSNLYGLVDGEYVPLERRGSWFWGYSYWYNGSRYTGQRYSRQQASQTRLAATKEAVNNLSETLLGYNGKDGNPSDTVEMALVSFATSSRTNVAKTTSASTFTDAVNGLTVATGYNAGTNWEAALKQADSIDFNDSDPTYVIFFSDGAPTFYGTGPSGNGQEEEPNMRYSYNAAVDDARTLATKIGADHFYTIFAYGEDYGATYMTNLTSAAGAPASNNYSASSTAELQEAFATILSEIETAGIGSVSIADGTTNKVATSSGTVSLLDVDTSSYKYYRAGGSDGENEKYDSDANTATTADGKTLQLGEEWEDAPDASFSDGTVDWDLSEVGILEDGVTYTVTFDCWPSQTTLDYIADIKNGKYDELPKEVKDYIDAEGNLKTNTTATLSYDDTRTPDEEEPIKYVNPKPVTSTAVEQLVVSKEWQNDVDSQTSAPIELEVTRDGTHKYDVVLSSENSWKSQIYISIGIMRTGEDGKMETLAPGHDFTFVEPEDIGYKWELDVPVVHPMLIDGELTMLVKVDEAHPAPSGAETYTIDGAEYYVDAASAASLTATNYRRSQLVLTKAVTGEGAPADARFPFTLTVNNSKADEGTAGDTHTDKYVWFLIADKSGKTVMETGYVTGGAQAEMKDGSFTGYYYAGSGAQITAEIPAGYSIRFINLPKDSTYTFTEGTLAAGFKFDKAELTAGQDQGFKGGQTSTGTVVDWNSEYAVTYTNKYVLTDVSVTKVWDDASDQDGDRPDKLELTLNGLPAGTTAPAPEVKKSTDGSTWTYTWKGLPKFNDAGKEIAYTVSENNVPEGYEVVGNNEVASGGTITNKHTPGTVDISVVKIWDDKDNQDGIRPESVTVQLKADGKNVGEAVTLDSSNKWTYTWEEQPVKKAGKEIEYTVEETSKLPEGYTAKVTGNVKDGFTVTNSYTPETTSVSVEKKWEDSNDQDGIRPRSVTVNLLANGTAVEGKELTLDASNSWKGTFPDLPKNANGTAIKYTVEEVKDNTVTGQDGDKTYAISVTGDAAKGFTVTNTHTPAKTTYSVLKVWDDANDKDGKRPESIRVQLYKGEGDAKEAVGDPVELTAGNKWTYTWENLPKMDDGKAVVYSADETEMPAGYTKKVEAGETSTTITNTHEADETTYTVTKVWDDEGDRDGLRPESIMVQLYADGEASGEPVELSEANNWTYTWENLVKNQDVEASEEPADPDAPAADPAAEEPVLTVEEVETALTEAVAEESAADDADEAPAEEPAETAVEEPAEAAPAEETVAAPAAEPTPIAYEAKEVSEVEGYTATYKETANGTIITNKHVPAKTQVAVKKIWDDDSDKAGARPDDATVQLYKTVGGEKTAVGKEVPIGTTKDTWTAVWADLPVLEDGEEITYSVEESLPDGCRYVSEVGDGVVAEAEDSGTIEITNTYKAQPVMSDPPVRKIVKGNPPTDATFTFQMKAVTDGAPMPEGSNNGIKTVQITGNGSYEFGEMWFYGPGEYVYELSEINDGQANYTYDTTQYTLTVKVTEEGEGDAVKLVKEETVTGGNGEIVFTNVYKEPAKGTKTGDNSMAGAALIVMLASGALIGLLRNRKREEN